MSYHDLESSPTGSLSSEEGARLAALVPQSPATGGKGVVGEEVSRSAYACFLMLGVGMLFPWNAFITATGAALACVNKSVLRLYAMSYLCLSAWGCVGTVLLAPL